MKEVKINGAITNRMDKLGMIYVHTSNHMRSNKYRRCFKKHALSDKAIIDVKECQIERFEMVYQLLRKAACFSEASSHTMSYPAVISFYSNGILFPCKMIASFKSGQEALPIIGAETIIANF